MSVTPQLRSSALAELPRFADPDRQAGTPATGVPPLMISCAYHRTQVTVRAYGEVDIASAPTLEAALRNAESLLTRRVVLNLSGLEFIDASGIHTLLAAQRRADANGHELVLAGVPSFARRVFALLGVDAELRLA